MGDQHLKGVISFQCYSHLFSAMNGISLQVFNPLPLISGKEVSNLLIWGDWNIIFSYMTYFNRQIEHDHFMQLAADVVQSGLAAISHYSEGFLIWKSSKINAEYFDIERESFVRMESAKFTFPEGLNPYQMQCALHAAQLRFFDHRHLSPMVAKEMLYFRAFLDPCELKIQGRILRFYPHITVHQNGVFQMHFRMISGGSLVSTREFINDFLNSPMSPADDILLPPALMRLDGRKLLFGDEYYDRRITRLHEWSRLEDVIDKFTFYAEGEPDSFSHNFISIDPEGKSKGPPVSLTTLTVMLGNALETLLNQPRMGWKYQFLGPKKARYTQGNFWSGVPAVYLLSMKDHPYMASEIHEKYASDLSHIMIRSKDIPTTHAGKHLGESLRLSEDYLCYSGTAVNLFVYSRSGIEDHDETDPNAKWLAGVE